MNEDDEDNEGDEGEEGDEDNEDDVHPHDVDSVLAADGPSMPGVQLSFKVFVIFFFFNVFSVGRVKPLYIYKASMSEVQLSFKVFIFFSFTVFPAA